MTCPTSPVIDLEVFIDGRQLINIFKYKIGGYLIALRRGEEITMNIDEIFQNYKKYAERNNKDPYPMKKALEKAYEKKDRYKMQKIEELFKSRDFGGLEDLLL